MSGVKPIRHVHLVGSVPLASSKDVFEMVSGELGPLAPRIPDGETGDRSFWIQFQRSIMEQTPNLIEVKRYNLTPDIVQVVYAVEDPKRPIVFGPLRYAAEAIDSYQKFANLKRLGVIPATTRFQVSLPTPLAVIANFVEESSQPQAEAAYEARLLAELAEIAAAIPPGELAVQWDAAVEVVFLAGWTGATYFDRTREGMLTRLTRLGNAVPSEIQLGFHLCYGDPGHKHLVEPADLSLCVELSNALSERVRRSIDWIHMPVPRERSDDDYFVPLGQLRTAAATEIFIGLVHLTDGVDGTRRRIDAVCQHRNEFGIATECGFGRRSPADVQSLLSIHRQAAQL
jgi:hypothetical protein